MRIIYWLLDSRYACATVLNVETFWLSVICILCVQLPPQHQYWCGCVCCPWDLHCCVRISSKICL